MSETFLKSLGAALPAKEPEQPRVPATNSEPEKIIDGTNKDLDTLIDSGISAMKEAFSKASDWKPSDQNRSREVGAALLNATLSAIAQKQKVAIKQIERADKQKGGGSPAANGTMNVTNNVITTERSVIMDLIRRSGGLSNVISGTIADEDSKS